MRCPSETREGVELLLALSRLDAQRPAGLDEHIRGCAGCAALVAAQQSVMQTLDLWEPPPVSPDFDRRLYRRIEQDTQWWDFLVRPFRPSPAARWLPVAAAAGLLMAVGLWIERPGTLPASPAPAQIGALPPEQAEHALQEMEIMQEFNRLVRSDPAEPRM